ncbi:MAG: zinc-ribbon domain containing protein [bacterium]|nr:zinc-ribbon domain containing protein [bacterium]
MAEGTTKSTCQDCGSEFQIVTQEKIFYKKKNLPEPKSCPDCRRKARLSLRNERKLYHRTCDKCQKKIISTYRPDSEYTVYCQDCFWKYIG